MRSRARPIVPQRNLRDWHPWFAWRPVRINLTVPAGADRVKMRMWVWLETIERQATSTKQVFWFPRWRGYKDKIATADYRIPEPK